MFNLTSFLISDNHKKKSENIFENSSYFGSSISRMTYAIFGSTILGEENNSFLMIMTNATRKTSNNILTSQMKVTSKTMKSKHNRQHNPKNISDSSKHSDVWICIWTKHPKCKTSIYTTSEKKPSHYYNRLFPMSWTNLPVPLKKIMYMVRVEYKRMMVIALRLLYVWNLILCLVKSNVY